MFRDLLTIVVGIFSLVVDFMCRPLNKCKGQLRLRKKKQLICTADLTKQSTRKKYVLCEKADQPSHCSQSQWHRSSMGYKGSLEPTAAATVWQKLADTMGKVRIPFKKKKILFLLCFCIPAWTIHRKPVMQNHFTCGIFSKMSLI